MIKQRKFQGYQLKTHLLLPTGLLDTVRVTEKNGERFRLSEYATVSVKDASTLVVNLFDADVRCHF